MEIKFAKIYDKYYVDDCIFAPLIGMECLIEWMNGVDLEQYFYVDEQGIIYEQNNGEAVGILYKLIGGNN